MENLSSASSAAIMSIGQSLCQFLAQLAELLIQADQNAVCVYVCECVYVGICICLDVNRGGTNRNRCTQRLVVLHPQTYTREP